MKRFKVVYTHTFQTDDVDPICDQDDTRIADGFVGYEIDSLMLAEGFERTVIREDTE